MNPTPDEQDQKRLQIEAIWQVAWLKHYHSTPPEKPRATDFDWAFWTALLEARCITWPVLDPRPEPPLAVGATGDADALQGVIVEAKSGRRLSGVLAIVHRGGATWSANAVSDALEAWRQPTATESSGVPVPLPIFAEQYDIAETLYGIERGRGVAYVIWRDGEKYGIADTLQEAREVIYRAACEAMGEAAKVTEVTWRNLTRAIERLGKDDVFNLGRFRID